MELTPNGQCGELLALFNTISLPKEEWLEVDDDEWKDVRETREVLIPTPFAHSLQAAHVLKLASNIERIGKRLTIEVVSEKEPYITKGFKYGMDVASIRF